MARSKTTTKAETENVTPIVTPTPVITAAASVPKVAKKTTKAASKTADAATTAAVKAVVQPVVVDVVKVDEPLEETGVVENVDSITEYSVEFLAKLQQINSLISSLKTEYRTLEKKWTRELKAAQKLSSKKKRKSGNRAPSGFVKPTKISDELANFLDKPLGSEMARTEVTRDINKYIRSNNLQDSENGRKINADIKLATLLKLQKTDELTYFNLQRYMSPHFAKANSVSAASPTVA
jgi:chromatin remodeling complex protein RSC6